MRDQHVTNDLDDEAVVDYKEWNRTLRLADWRVFALLMVLVAILAGSFLPFFGGASIFNLLILRVISIKFLVAVLFYVLWGAVLYQTISGHGFRRVSTNAFWFLGYIAGAYFVLILVSSSSYWGNGALSLGNSWGLVVAACGGSGFYIMILASLVMLFMGMCFNAQMEVAVQMSKIKGKK